MATINTNKHKFRFYFCIAFIVFPLLYVCGFGGTNKYIWLGCDAIVNSYHCSAMTMTVISCEAPLAGVDSHYNSWT